MYIYIYVRIYTYVHIYIHTAYLRLYVTVIYHVGIGKIRECIPVSRIVSFLRVACYGCGTYPKALLLLLRPLIFVLQSLDPVHCIAVIRFWLHSRTVEFSLPEAKTFQPKTTPKLNPKLLNRNLYLQHQARNPLLSTSNSQPSNPYPPTPKASSSKLLV